MFYNIFHYMFIIFRNVQYICSLFKMTEFSISLSLLLHWTFTLLIWNLDFFILSKNYNTHHIKYISSNVIYIFICVISLKCIIITLIIFLYTTGTFNVKFKKNVIFIFVMILLPLATLATQSLLVLSIL